MSPTGKWPLSSNSPFLFPLPRVNDGGVRVEGKAREEGTVNTLTEKRER